MQPRLLNLFQSLYVIRSKETKTLKTISMLEELFALTVIESEGNLTESESARYLELVEQCYAQNIEIPFG
jgi:uncharacterized tellurite resistance protein B-like protein